MESKNDGLFIVGTHTSKGKFKNMYSAIINNNSIAPSRATQIFTHGPRHNNRNNIDYEKMRLLSGVVKIFIHAPYTCFIFKGSDNAFDIMLDIFRAAQSCNSSGVIIHLPRASINVIVNNVVRLLKMLNDEQIKTPIILETPSNKPHPTMSWESPEKLTRLINAFNSIGIDPNRIGLCIDTAHVYAGGAQISTRKDATVYLKGLPIERVYLFHLNGNEYKFPKSGDKHAIPLSNLDAIWGCKKYKESGCFEFVDWSRSLGIPIIFEGKIHHSSDDVNSFIKMCGRV